MFKKILFLSLAITTTAFIFWKNEPSKNAAKPVSSITSTVAKGPLPSPNDSPQLKIEKEIVLIKKELSEIDVPGELNNSHTTVERRKIIIDKINLYTHKAGQLARLQIAEMEKEASL